MSKYTEEQLKKLKVAELKELCGEEGVEIESSWKKADIIQALLQVELDEEIVEEVIEDVVEEEVIEEPADEVEEVEEPADEVEEVEEVVEEIKDEPVEAPQEFKPYRKELKTLTAVYKDQKLKKYTDKVKGFVEVIEETPETLVVKYYRSGRGRIVGHISK